MCLDELGDFEVKQDWGWQAFTKYDGKIYRRFSAPDDPPTILDKWHKDRKRKAICCSLKEYPTGFHISLTEDGARWWADHHSSVIKKVYFKENSIVAKGCQSKYKFLTIVARERYVCDKTKRPPKE